MFNFAVHLNLCSFRTQIKTVKMKTILVPIGSSENSVNTLQYAIDLAVVFKAKIAVLRAYSPHHYKSGTMINVDEILERESNLYLRSVIKASDRKGIDISLISARGNVLDSIASIDAELGVDLIVMGPKSNSIKEEAFLGHTSGSVVKKSSIPVLIVPEGYVFKPFESVLTAFKSGIITEKDVLKPLEYFIHVFNPVVNLLLVKTPTYTAADLILDKKLDAIKSSLTITENATTFLGVLEHFRENNPDLLCVFRRKRGFFQKMWEKSSILKKEFNCNIPLLVLSEKKK